MKRLYAVVRAVFAYAVDADLLLRSPAARSSFSLEEAPDRTNTDGATLERLALELGDLAPMVWIGVVTSLRWGEVAGLTVGAVDLLRATVAVTPQVNRGGIVRPPKTERS
jgi:hypothetical protein